MVKYQSTLNTLEALCQNFFGSKRFDDKKSLPYSSVLGLNAILRGAKRRGEKPQLGTNPPFVPRKNSKHRYTASVAFNNA